MKKQKRLTLLLAVLLSAMILVPAQVLAMDEVDIPPADEIEQAGETYSEAFTLERSILNGSASIQKTSSTTVKCIGKSTVSPSNSNLRVLIQLQQYKGGKWVAYRSASKFVNGTSVELTKTFTVEKGYYYRVHTTHSANGVANKYATTKGVLVS